MLTVKATPLPLPVRAKFMTQHPAAFPVSLAASFAIGALLTPIHGEFIHLIFWPAFVFVLFKSVGSSMTFVLVDHAGEVSSKNGLISTDLPGLAEIAKHHPKAFSVLKHYRPKIFVKNAKTIPLYVEQTPSFYAASRGNSAWRTDSDAWLDKSAYESREILHRAEVAVDTMNARQRALAQADLEELKGAIEHAQHAFNRVGLTLSAEPSSALSLNEID